MHGETIKVLVGYSS